MSRRVSCFIFMIGICLAGLAGCERAAPGDAEELPQSADARHAAQDPLLGSESPSATADPELAPHTFRQIHMAMPVEITVWSASEEAAQAAARAAFAQFALVDRLMNDYVEGSEISRLSDSAGSGPVAVSPQLLEVLLHAQRMHELTGGAFDPTAAPLVLLWREATRTGELPDPERLAAARRLVGMDNVRIDPAAGTVELTRPGMRLDLGGIAKGYACDLATAELRRHGHTITFVHAGGDMVLGDPPPGSDGWEIDIPARATASPEREAVPPRPASLTLANTAVSLSGDTERYVIIGGTRYSHILDPRTGIGVTTRRMALVTAPRGLDTDPLATAGCIMEPEAFASLVAELEGVAAQVFPAPEPE